MASRDDALRRNSFGDAAAATLDPAVRMNQTRPGTMAPTPGAAGTGPLAMPRGGGTTPFPPTREGATTRNVPIDPPAAPVAAPDNIPNAFTQAAVAGARLANPTQPPAAPRAPIVNPSSLRPEPTTMFTNGDRPFRAQSGFAPPPPAAPKPTFADSMNAAQAQLDAQTASGPAAATPPLTPQQQLSKDIINNPTQRGVVAPPFTTEQKTQGRANTSAGSGYTPPSLRGDNVTRVGNSYSGPAGIKAEGMTINGRAPGGGFSVLGSDEARAYTNAMAAQYDARMAAEQSGLRGGYTPQRAEGRLGYSQQEARDLLKQAMTKQPGESRADFATRSGAALKALGLEVDERGNIRTNDTSRANNEATNATTRRGQNLSELSSQRTAQTARENALRDQYNKDREFGLNLTKEQRATREEAQTALGKRLDTFATRMVDGKPVVDPTLRARSEEAVNALLGRSIDAALKAGNTKLAQQIQAEGAAGIDESLLRQTLRNLELQQSAKQDDGPWLWNGSYVDSDNPDDFAPKLGADGKPVIEKGFFGENAVLRGGSRVDKSYINSYNGATTRRYDQ